MQMNSYELLFIFGVGSMAMCLLFTLLMFFMYPLTPKGVVKKYFRPPYFSEAFVDFYSGFPIVLYRGMIFMRLAAFPDSGKKRNLTEVYKEVPNWYIAISKVILIGFYITFSAFVLSLVLFAFVFGI